MQIATISLGAINGVVDIINLCEDNPESGNQKPRSYQRDRAAAFDD